MRLWAALLLLWTGAASAGPESSPRPPDVQREGLVLEPSGAITPPPGHAAGEAATARGLGIRQSLRPELRPRSVRRMVQDQERLLKRGAVCGDLAIQGEVVGRVKGTKAGCGVDQAVRVRAIAGIELSQHSVMDCTTAKALKTWIDDTAKPALAGKGGGLKRLRVAAHYICRTRNNRVGGKVSEHGKGRAIDISGLRLQDGTLITVRNGWNGAETGPILRDLHSGACGPFGTVLGPEADRFHLDHFHFDTARYRSGTVCR